MHYNYINEHIPYTDNTEQLSVSAVNRHHLLTVAENTGIQAEMLFCDVGSNSMTNTTNETSNGLYYNTVDSEELVAANKYRTCLESVS